MLIPVHIRNDFTAAFTADQNYIIIPSKNLRKKAFYYIACIFIVAESSFHGKRPGVKTNSSRMIVFIKRCS